MILTFDCYGTLIDWEKGISQACIRAAAADGVTLDRTTVLRLHAEIEPRIQAAGFATYRSVLARVALEIAARTGWVLREDAAEFLPESLPRWPPFPDTNDALETLRGAGHQLGILSNVDNDLLAGTLDHLSVEFDFLVTAQDVGAYKPAAPHFERAGQFVQGREWTHVAQSYFHDVEPAVARNLPVVWINRNREALEGRARPTAEYPTLGAFARDLVSPAEA